jgi:hypothetical protein
MKKFIFLIAIALPFASMSASAEVMQYSKCTLRDGKTIQDMQAWVTSWRTLVKQAGKQYQVRILLPHAAQLELNQFYIEGSSPTLTTYAAGWEWWYADPQALKSNAQLVSIAACEANEIYMTAD